MKPNQTYAAVVSLLLPALFASCFVLLSVACRDGEDADMPLDESGRAVSDMGSCTYVSPFTRETECKDYVGADWTEESAITECDTLAGTFDAQLACSTTYRLGTCELTSEAGFEYVVSSYGDIDSCELQKTGCELFGGGSWTSEGLCESGAEENVFIQPTLECRDAIEGEAPGSSFDGKVCTWQAISGCTEEGRRFSDYASCDVVRSQRPHYPAPPATNSARDDARLEDPTYVAELGWVKEQVEASACICCHSTEDALEGPSNWFVESPVNWINSLGDSGIAFGANVTPTLALGAYPPEENNGFERETSGFPSTDPLRMRTFFENEMTHRGLTAEDFANAVPFGGPIYDQLLFEPQRCTEGEGIGSDGLIRWDGGPARYVYVMEPDSQNPTVPPNLDRPEGTLWRLDVPATGSPIDSESLTYGAVPAGLEQVMPTNGDAEALRPGRDYYLYVTRDVGIPITRCLFRY